MMFRKWFVLFAAALVAGGASTAQAQILIGDFETATLDGWEGQGDNAGPGPGPTTGLLAQTQVAELQTIGGIYKAGVPNNTGNALRLLPGLANFWSLTLNQADRPNLAAEIAANRQLKANVSFRVAPFTFGNFGSWEKIALNGQPGGWVETAGPTGAGGVGGNAWNTGLGSQTYEITWNLTPLVITDTAPGANAQLILSINYDRGSYTTAAQPNGPAFYIDNIRLVPIPEPSSLALLGLGSIAAVLRRRRRS